MSDFDPAVAASVGTKPDDPELPGRYGALAFIAELQRKRNQALHYALHALAVEVPLGESDENAAIREAQFPSVHLNAGAVMLREAARLRLAGSERPMIAQSLASELLHQAWDGIMQRRDGRPHQHEINAKSFMSNLESVEGRPDSAFGMAMGAVALGFLSESPRYVDHTSNLGFRGRVFSKAKAVSRGVGAAGVAILSTMSGRRVERARDWLMLKTS